MNPAIWICCFLPLIIALLMQRKQKKVSVINYIKRKKNREESILMQELAKRFIGKECLIYTIDGNVVGEIKEVTDGGLIIDHRGNLQAVNLDFVLRIQEYPTNKNGKKKAIIG